MREKTCCVAGHRDVTAEQVTYVKQELRREVGKAIVDGYTHFITDFMDGTDTLFAEVIVEVMQENEAIQLEALLPYNSKYDKLVNNKKTLPLILACGENVVFSSDKYAPNCIATNRREQLKRSGRMIVVFDGRDEGGTIRALRLAHVQQVQIREIPLG